MATKKILIQVILDDKASASNQKLGNALGKTTGKFKEMTAAQEKQYISEQKSIIQQTQYTNSLKKRALAEANVANAANKNRTQSGLNNAILLESGRLASDLNYGFTAIANNLGQLVTLFGSFAETNGGVIASLKALGKSLWGMGGILIGVQLLIAFGPKILDFFMGITAEMKEAKKAMDKLNKSLDTLGAKVFQAQKYVDLIDDINTSEETRINLTNELISLIPALTKEDFKYGKNLDEVREKINEYALSQATRLEIDKLVEQNSEILSDAATVRRIRDIKSEEEKTLAMRKFLEQQGMDVDARIRARKVGALKDDLGAGALDFIGTDAETIESEFNMMTVAALLASKEIEEQLKELYKNLRKAGDFGKKETVEVLELFKKGLETNELYLLGFTGQQIMAMEALSEGVKERKDELNDFGDAYIAKTKQITEAENLEAKARVAIREGYFAAIKSISKGLSDLGAMNDNFKIASIITEKAEAIANVIVSTKKSNTAISVAANARAALGDVTAVPKGQARILRNKITSGINIAGIVAAAAGGISAIKSKTSSGISSLGGSGGGGGDVTVEAPDFNVVGQGVGSQLAGVVSNQFGGALRAYVVSGDISSAQELDRKINTTATIG